MVVLLLPSVIRAGVITRQISDVYLQLPGKNVVFDILNQRLLKTVRFTIESQVGFSFSTK